MADLVLVHGITESKASWDPLVQPLSSQHRVLAIDLPGHGAASRNAPFDLMTMATDALGEMNTAGFAPERSVLIGHSLGGTVVSAMASAVSVLGVINVDQPLKLADFQAGLRQLEPMLRGDEASFQTAISMVFDAMRGPLSAAETKRIESIRHPEQQVVLGVWEPVLSSTVEELDALVEAMGTNVNAPYLSLHGIDPGDGYATWLTSLIQTAIVEIWPDHGHYPHLVDPQRFVARVNEFVQSI